MAREAACQGVGEIGQSPTPHLSTFQRGLHTAPSPVSGLRSSSLRPSDERLFCVTSARGVLAAASAAVGMKINHRTLRQLFATRAIEAGVPVAIAARLLTHQDGGQTLLRNYIAWREEPLRAALARMETGT